MLACAAMAFSIASLAWARRCAACASASEASCSSALTLPSASCSTPATASCAAFTVWATALLRISAICPRRFLAAASRSAAFCASWVRDSSAFAAVRANTSANAFPACCCASSSRACREKPLPVVPSGSAGAARATGVACGAMAAAFVSGTVAAATVGALETAAALGAGAASAPESVLEISFASSSPSPFVSRLLNSART
mmetsp:Transcript_30966/g.70357  ORF Transcript_30966/g.70357 Transcript_30966/m.70357 type:complete len:200 (+) Transcript_30966:141-740(+)